MASYQYACKLINKAAMLTGANAAFYTQAMRNELDILQRVTAANHPNVIAFKEYFEDDTTLYLVMECAGGGELFDRIQARGRYSEADAQLVIKQMLQGVKLLHDLDIVHADLKPDNFLFADASEKALLKMIDFGQAQRVRPRQLLKEIAGTPFYMAPELVTHQYNKSCDLWSVGVIMYVLLYGYPPFYADDDKRIFQLIRGGFQPRTLPGYGPWFKNDIKVSEAAKNLIARLLQTDVAARLTAAEALEHDWINADQSTAPIDQAVLLSLKDFQQASRFKQAVCWLMSQDIASEVEDWMQTGIFARLDKDKSGSISLDELRAHVLALPAAEQSMLCDMGGAEGLMRSLDLNGDGQISSEEWMLFLVNRRLSAKEERLHQAFRKFDLNGDGKISAAEVKAVLHTDSDQAAASLLLEVDQNGDGSIDYEECVATSCFKIHYIVPHCILKGCFFFVGGSDSYVNLCCTMWAGSSPCGPKRWPRLRAAAPSRGTRLAAPRPVFKQTKFKAPPATFPSHRACRALVMVPLTRSNMSSFWFSISCGFFSRLFNCLLS